MAKPLIVMILLATALGCRQERRRPEGPRPVGVETSDVGSIHRIGADTLSDSARITHLFPEPDGASVAFTFVDSARHVTSGLGLLIPGRDTAQLVRADSVTAVWWSAPRRLAFQSGSGSGIHSPT